ncbi:MAG: aspartyl protease family protein [Candidatus Eremiobacteraeota bacterium]|nr:aspartyl protease family protein [Candidatus Eremiobacteraeota bacterium]
MHRVDAPPAGIITTAATLDDVLAGYDKLHAANRWTTFIEEGNVRMYGLTGTYRQVISKNDFSVAVNLGMLSHKDGSRNGQQWYQNSNGIVMLQHDTHQENEIAEAALAHHTRNKNEGLALIGEAAAPLSAYVVEVNAKGGRHEWQYFDKRTFELVRSEQVYPTKRVIVTYDDFRTTRGVTWPWHYHRSDGHPQNDEDYVTTSALFSVQVAPIDLDIPRSKEDLAQFPAGGHAVKLPAQIIGGRVIVRVVIDGRGYDFQLDSGASSIVVDAGLAKKLDLTMMGESVQSAGGTYEQKQALIGEMHVGDIVMKNVVVDTTSFTVQEDIHTKVVGLLGFDFIANAGVKIDYRHSIVEAMPPYLFVPPAEGVPIDAVWDDGVPRIPVQLGDAAAHFVLDTGADVAFIYQRFAQAHPETLGGNAGLDTIRGTGVGGSFALRPTQVKVLTVAGTDYHNMLMYEIINNPGFEYEDYDGLLGAQFLKDFTVYIDYKDSHIYLTPNGQPRL